MAYYLVDVSKASHGISYLTNAKHAVIESIDKDSLYNANIRIHIVDYKECRDTWTCFRSPSEQENTWIIEKEFNSLPSVHRFKIGDKVVLKKNYSKYPTTAHVYDEIYEKHDEPLTVSMLHYYEWGDKSYAVIGFRDSYDAWAPEEMFDLYTEEPKRDKGGFNVGDQVLVNVYQGCGIPYPLDRDEIVTIVDDSYSRQAGGSDHWTHIAAFNGGYVALDYVRGNFRRIPQEPNPCKEVPLPDTFTVTDNGSGHIGTVVTTDIYPGYESYFRDVLISEEPIPEKETKIQILKLQQPINLKSKKHKSWK